MDPLPVLAAADHVFGNPMKIFAVVTWYDPIPAYVHHLGACMERLAGVVVVDDSELSHAHLLAQVEGVIYVKTARNSGIAHALNLGYRRADAEGADWVLTMDQDSAWNPLELERFLEAASVFALDPSVAIIAPNFTGSGIPLPGDGSLGPRTCDGVISAGSLVRLHAFRVADGYNEALFIDQVDHEFGYRLRRQGLTIVRLEGIQLTHSVGERREVTVFGRTLVSEGHTAMRKYYIVRNGLYIREHFKDFPGPHLERIALLALGVLFLENNKISKLWHIAKGILHHGRGISGKLA